MLETYSSPEQQPPIIPSPETEGFLEQLQMDGENRSAEKKPRKALNLSESGSMVDAQALEASSKAALQETTAQRELPHDKQKEVLGSWIKEMDAGTKDAYESAKALEDNIPGE